MIKRLTKLFCLQCSCTKIVEKPNENLKVIKNILPNKSGNPESFKKYSEQLESSSTNVYIVDKDLLRAL